MVKRRRDEGGGDDTASALMDDVAEWVRSRGGHVHASLCIGGDAVRGIRTKDAHVRQGDVLLRVPLSCCLTSVRACAELHASAPAAAEALLDAASSGQLRHELGDIALALALCRAVERGSSCETHMRHLLRTTPGAQEMLEGDTALPAHACALQAGGGRQHASALLAEWEALLSPSPVHAHIADEVGKLLASHKAVDSALAQSAPPLRDFLWAMAVVSSRTFTVPFDGVAAAGAGAGAEAARTGAYGESCLALVPLMDILNHKRPRETAWRLDADRSAGLDGAMEMTALQPFAAGIEVHDNYGAAGNGPLLVRYGFTVAHNFEPDNSCNDTLPYALCGTRVELRAGPPAYSFGPLAKLVDAVMGATRRGGEHATRPMAATGTAGEYAADASAEEDELDDEALDALYGADDKWEEKAKAQEAQAEAEAQEEDELDDEALDALYGADDKWEEKAKAQEAQAEAEAQEEDELDDEALDALYGEDDKLAGDEGASDTKVRGECVREEVAALKEVARALHATACGYYADAPKEDSPGATSSPRECMHAHARPVSTHV